jgi:hypothetical protein
MIIPYVEMEQFTFESVIFRWLRHERSGKCFLTQCWGTDEIKRPFAFPLFINVINTTRPVRTVKLLNETQNIWALDLSDWKIWITLE